MIKSKVCKFTECGESYTPARQPDSGYCSPRCLYADKPQKPRTPIARTPIKKSTKKINRVSKKRANLQPKYNAVRLEVLEEANYKCFVKGCNKIADTAEHRMGRKGFADDWARENNIPLLVDKRFLAACCGDHNREFENNSELSNEYQLSKIHGGKKGN